MLFSMRGTSLLLAFNLTVHIFMYATLAFEITSGHTAVQQQQKQKAP